MIRALVDFALKSRWLVLGGVVLLSAWGIVSFRALPIEAYPDVANNYVQIITQWPGRSAEEIERQVTVPVEIQMAGIPHLTHLRSTTLAGLSSLMLVFDDDSTSDLNREHVLERLSMVSLPANLVPQMGTDWSPVGQIYWYTLESTNPSYDVMEKKSLEDWSLEKSFKSVNGVVDVSSFGGPTKEYQIKLSPEKMVSYGLSISQVEQQIANNNTNGGGSFIEQGSQQINVQSVGLFTSVQDIENTVVKTQNGAAITIKDIATVSQGPRSAWDRLAARRTVPTVRLWIIPTRLKASCCCRKARTLTQSSRAFTRKSTSSTRAFCPRASRSCRSLTAPSSSPTRWKPLNTTSPWACCWSPSFSFSFWAMCAGQSSCRSPFPSR